MNAYLPFDEYRLIVLIPAELEEAKCQATQRVLENQPFCSSFRRAVRQVVCWYLDLNKVRVAISN